MSGARAMIEAELDFADEEDIPGSVSTTIWHDVIRIRDEIAAHLKDDRRGERLRSGLQVVLLGVPNAGKSSLLNALARRDVAIVTEEAGTTRDLIEVHLDLGGYPVTLVDTAGLREQGAGVVEREGMRRALERAGAADIVLWLAVAGSEREAHPEMEGNAEVWRIATKSDLRGAAADEGGVPCSVVSAGGLDDLLSRLTRFASETIGYREAPALTRARHRDGLRRCLEGLERALDDEGRALELRAEDLAGSIRRVGADRRENGCRGSARCHFPGFLYREMMGIACELCGDSWGMFHVKHRDSAIDSDPVRYQVPWG